MGNWNIEKYSIFLTKLLEKIVNIDYVESQQQQWPFYVSLCILGTKFLYVVINNKEDAPKRDFMSHIYLQFLYDLDSRKLLKDRALNKKNPARRL